MSAQDERLRLALKGLAYREFTTVAAEVLEVDKKKLTVDVKPIDGGAEIFGVRLRANIDEQRGGLVLVPVVGSTVLVSTVNDNWNSAYVAMVSEVDLITFKTTKESLKKWQKDFLDAIGRMVFSTNSGPTIQLINAAEFTSLAARLDNLFLD